MKPTMLNSFYGLSLVDQISHTEGKVSTVQRLKETLKEWRKENLGSRSMYFGDKIRGYLELIS